MVRIKFSVRLVSVIMHTYVCYFRLYCLFVH